MNRGRREKAKPEGGKSDEKRKGKREETGGRGRD